MRGLFLDRDGVIIRKADEGDYITQWDEVEFLPGSLEAIAELGRHGFAPIIVTNQRGVARGLISQSNLDDIHSRLKCAVAAHGGYLSEIYYCPHDISHGCNCRKPKPGMLLRAAEEYQLCLPECWMVGDAATDIAAGKNAGCHTALITKSAAPMDSVNTPDVCAESLAAAAMQILRLKSEGN